MSYIYIEKGHQRQRYIRKRDLVHIFVYTLAISMAGRGDCQKIQFFFFVSYVCHCRFLKYLNKNGLQQSVHHTFLCV